MKLMSPDQVRQLYAVKKQWFTIEEISKGMGMSTQTISKALRGLPMRPKTVKEIAGSLDVPVTEIATFLKN